MELLNFHGLSRMAFTLNQDEIRFQKMVAFLKHILKTHQANERQMKLDKEFQLKKALRDEYKEPEATDYA